MKPLPRQKVNSRMDGRLAAYATLAGAALAVPALAPEANATVVYSGPISINIPSTTAGIYVNIGTGAFGSNAGTTGWDINPWSSSSLSLFNDTASGSHYVGTGTTYFNLLFGTLISAASTFATVGVATVNGATPLNVNSSGNIIGFSFLNNAQGNALQYGWARISLSATPQAQPRAIVEYAYENTGAPILAGQVPEPSTVALLGVMAAGAIGVRAWRRRKAA